MSLRHPVYARWCIHIQIRTYIRIDLYSIVYGCVYLYVYSYKYIYVYNLRTSRTHTQMY